MTFREKGLNIYLYSLLPLQKSQITLVKPTKQSDITKCLQKCFYKIKFQIEALWTKLLKSYTAAADFKISHFTHVVQKTKPVLCY